MLRTSTCQTCGQEFTRDYSQVLPERKYCSRACTNIGRRRNDGTATELECRKCGETRPVAEFYPHSGILRGYQYWCKDCTRIARASRQKTRPAQETIRRWKLWALYRIREEDYDEMYRRQEGACAICKTPQEPWSPGLGMSRTGFLVVDHDHTAGANARGLLCNRCNLGLGYFRDNLELLASAVAYLGRPPAKVALTSSVSAVLASI